MFMDQDKKDMLFQFFSNMVTHNLSVVCVITIDFCVETNAEFEKSPSWVYSASVNYMLATYAKK